MKDREYFLAQARIEVKRQEDWDVEAMANKLQKEYRAKLQEEKQANCVHEHTFSYNHGYHTICEDCGKEL